jgi:hypothetical protein
VNVTLSIDYHIRLAGMSDPNEDADEFERLSKVACGDSHGWKFRWRRKFTNADEEAASFDTNVSSRLTTYPRRSAGRLDIEQQKVLLLTHARQHGTDFRPSLADLVNHLGSTCACLGVWAAPRYFAFPTQRSASLALNDHALERDPR